MGRVLFETGGWISNARVSRDGRSVAFLDHPSRGDNQSAVKVVSADGDSRAVTPCSPGPRTAWPGPRRVNDLLFPTGSTLTATDLSGRSRALFRVLGFVMLHDVSAQGRVLVGRTTAQREIVGRAPGEPGDRGLSWLDWSFPTALSDDGRFVLFEEQNLPASTASSSGARTARRPSAWGTAEASLCRPTGGGCSPTQRAEGGARARAAADRRGRDAPRWDAPRSSPRAPGSCPGASGS
jgi:hypothetical protein